VKRAKLLGIAVIAAMLIGAIAAASASAALPEWGQCVKFINQHGVGVGKYSDPGCTKLAEPAKTGDWEFKTLTKLVSEGFEPQFTSHGGEAALETTLGIKTVCKAEEATGELSGTKEVKAVVVIFKGCESNFGGLACENSITPPLGEEPPGQIRTRELKGKLAYISGKGTESPVVGLSLEPEAKKNLFAEFICGNVLIVRVGQSGYDGTGVVPKGAGNDSIISPITPVNMMSITNTQTYSAESGIQAVTHFEGGPEDFLETEISDGFGEIPFGESGQTLTTINTLNNNQKLEVKG
jgi:hypothetical protein